MSSPDSHDAFGANSWLIDEMRDAYEADPQSVDASWREFFGGNGAATSEPSKAASPPTPPSANKTEQPAPKAEATKAAEKAEPKASEPAKAAPRPESAPAKPAAKAEPAKAEGAPSKKQVESVKQGGEAPHNPGTGAGLSANAPNPALRPEPTSSEPKYTVLRGAPMRTAKNMETSLTVPTATSVRSVPMKLVIDQRTVINNFLRTSKGGKVSFTHIIGFAMVQALKALPEMNNAYDVVDGKPNLIENPAINLGIAIDVKKGDTRQLLVPNIKGCENLNFFQFWSAYETVVKKTRDGDLQVSDFAGTTASLTNP
ncbi:MAG TPA: 2-oxo acid dehydrogenase subunit E2, partial [Tessaracoccus flavescens]|nr:2-oxo acid dehydrogenase subunit E2 [Tessaracoccus flavescens]